MSNERFNVVVIADYETELSDQDKEYLTAHLKVSHNFLIVFGEWFFVNNNKAFDYVSINSFLYIYGVQFSEGSFSKEICDETGSSCYNYISGCSIDIGNNKEESESLKIVYLKGMFEIDSTGEQQEIIYYAEIETKQQSYIYLLADSTCIEEAFSHKNCYKIVEKAVN